MQGPPKAQEQGFTIETKNSQNSLSSKIWPVQLNYKSFIYWESSVDEPKKVGSDWIRVLTHSCSDENRPKINPSGRNLLKMRMRMILPHRLLLPLTCVLRKEYWLLINIRESNFQIGTVKCWSIVPTLDTCMSFFSNKCQVGKQSKLQFSVHF